MSTITVLVPDDLAPNQNKEREYDVCYTMERAPRSKRHGSAGFHVHMITGEDGRLLTAGGGEFGLVAEHAENCYYEEMLAAARGEPEGKSEGTDQRGRRSRPREVR